MKIANILFAIQSHSSTHPYSWCKIEFKNLNKSGLPRTLKTLKKDYEAFVGSGADNMKAEKYKNVIHQSLISSDSEKSFILD